MPAEPAEPAAPLPIERAEEVTTELPSDANMPSGDLSDVFDPADHTGDAPKEGNEGTGEDVDMEPESPDQSPLDPTNGIWISPDQLLNQSVVVYMPHDHQVFAISNQDSCTVEQLCNAQVQFQPGVQLKAWSIVGQLIPMSDLIANWEAIILTDDADGCFATSPGVMATSLPRTRTLFHQGALVAHDEMHYYLHSMQKSDAAYVIPPLVIPDGPAASDIAKMWVTDCIRAASDKPAVSALLHEGHWVTSHHPQW